MPGSNADTSMEQVRELLMGTQLKDMENRLQRQEKRFLRELADVQESIKNRVESLENFMKSEAASLLHRLQEEQTERAAAIRNEEQERAESLKAEQHERNEALKKDRADREAAIGQLAKELAKREEALDRKLTALSGTLDATEQELRKLLLSENARLSEKVEEKYKDALRALNTTAAELRHDLVSRSSLSGLFTEAAIKFSGEWPSAAPHSAPTPDSPLDSNGESGDQDGNA